MINPLWFERLFDLNNVQMFHDDVIKWKYFPRYWPFVSPVNSLHKGQWCGALMLNKRLSKQSWGWWLETLSRSLWRHCNVLPCFFRVSMMFYNRFYWSHDVIPNFQRCLAKTPMLIIPDDDMSSLSVSMTFALNSGMVTDWCLWVA